MATVPNTPISAKPALTPVLPTDRLVGVRTPQNQTDPSLRVGPISLGDAATAIRPLLNLTTNNLPGTDKRVRFLTAAQLAADTNGGDCLDNLDPATLVLGGLAWVEFHPTQGYGVSLRLLYDSTPRTPAGSGLNAYRTGDMVAGDTVPVRWVLAGGPEQGVPVYAQKPTGYIFAVNELVRSYASDTANEQFFAATAATALPAPTVSTGDVNWRAISPSTLPAPVAPLYAATGTNTNGAMTQAATTAALNAKADIAALSPIVGISASGQIRSYATLDAAAVDTNAVLILNRPLFTLSSSLNFGATNLVGLPSFINTGLNNLTFTTTQLTDIGVYGQGVLQVTSGGMSRGSLGIYLSLTNNTFLLDNVNASGAQLAGAGTLAISNGTVLPVGATPAGITLQQRNIATATTLGTVRGGGTGNVSINADGSMTATAAAAAASFASVTGLPTDNANLSTALNAKQAADTLSVLTYAASIAIDFNTETVRTLAATGNVAFAASLNVALLKTKELYLTNTTGAAITLSFPAGWSFFPGPAPTSLAAGKQAVLTLRSLGTTDSTIKAAYVAQA